MTDQIEEIMKAFDENTPFGGHKERLEWLRAQLTSLATSIKKDTEERMKRGLEKFIKENSQMTADLELGADEVIFVSDLRALIRDI